MDFLHVGMKVIDFGTSSLLVRTEREWQALSAAIGRPELAADPRFATAQASQAHDGELIQVLAARFAEQPSAAWEDLLSSADAGCADAGLAGYPAFTGFDQGLREAGFTAEVERRRFGPMVVWAPHLRIPRSPRAVV